MPKISAAQLRDRAAHARRLADDMFNREAQSELHDIASAMDAEADQLDGCEITGPVPGPTSTS